MSREPKRYMIDLETMGLMPGCVVTQIGIVQFTSIGKVGRGVNIGVEVKDQRDRGLEIDPATEKWWTEQVENGHPGPYLPNERQYKLEAALSRVTAALEGADEFWAWGSDFDMPILAALYDRCGLRAPWRAGNGAHKKVRCARTLLKTCSLPAREEAQRFRFAGVEHNALDDARHMAGLVAAVFRS